jgi:hypothetical protein
MSSPGRTSSYERIAPRERADDRSEKVPVRNQFITPLANTAATNRGTLDNPASQAETGKQPPHLTRTVGSRKVSPLMLRSPLREEQRWQTTRRPCNMLRNPLKVGGPK